MPIATPTNRRITASPATRISGRCRAFTTEVRMLCLLAAALANLWLPAHAESPGSVLWGVMDWKLDALPPATDTSTTSPLYGDGHCRIICHQYQSSNWLAFKVSSTNKIEISRIYGAGNCINLMLYFVSCTHDTNLNTFSYPLNNQFLLDFTQLVNAYKVGGGPLYIQVFPEFEEWYNNKSSTEADQYRAQIRSQFLAMAQIAHTNYSRAYIGLCFEGGDFTGDTSQFTNRWDPVLTNSDLIFVNFMTPFVQANTQARAMIKATTLLSHWGLPIMFPYVDLWDDSNTPIFTTGDDYNTDAANFSNYITNWIGNALTAPTEVQGSSSTNWLTSLGTLKSRGLFAYSLYRAAWCNNSVTPPDPNGVTHPQPSYTMLTNVMSSNSRSYLYPVVEMECSASNHPPAASPAYHIGTDTNCSSSALVVLDATNATGQYFTYRAPVTHDGTYEVLIGIRKQTDGGWFNLYVNGSGAQLGSERNCSLATNVSNYQEYDQGAVTFSGITGTTWTDFKFGVTRAGNGGGYKLALDYIKLIPQTPALIPQPPSGLTAGGGSTGQVVLNWNASAWATSYAIGRSTTSGGPYTTIATNVTNPSYTNSGLSSNTVYYYVVSAVGSAGSSANSSEASATPGLIIVDDADATGVTITGGWSSSTSTPGYYGTDYLHDGNTGTTGGKSVRFSPHFTVAGSNNVYLRWTSAFNRASNVPVDVNYSGGKQTFTINQQNNGGTWVLLGTFNFDAGTNGSVVVRNDAANGYVVADAVEFESIGAAPPGTPQFTKMTKNTKGQLQLNFQGDTNSSYHIWASSNLVDWVDLGPGILTKNGSFQFTDPSSTNQKQRFYRAVKP